LIKNSGNWNGKMVMVDLRLACHRDNNGQL
jgi:hypothetical protein